MLIRYTIYKLFQNMTDEIEGLVMTIFFGKEFFKVSLLRLRRYGIWLSVNFLLSAIPFAAMYAMDYSYQTLFSNFLSFNFALLISNLYVLFFVIETNLEASNRPIFLLISTLFWILIVILTFVLYPKFPNQHLFNFFSYNLKYISLIIICVTAIISLLLNKSSIEQSIIDKRENQKASQDIQEHEKITANFKDFSRELEMDEIL